MLKLIAAIAALVLPAAAMAQSAPPVPDPAPIEVMILGSYHMNNPGRDVHNARIDPVTTPAKQAQLEALSEALARFRPTAVAIEREPRDLATLLDHRYPAFTPADLLTNGDERIQIGYRLAHRLGLERVYAIDEGEREGQPSYFPFEAVQAWAVAHGRQDDLDAIGAQVGVMVAEMEVKQRELPVAAVLAWMNDPAAIARNNSFYGSVMGFGAGEDQPGAVLNGRWYTRNAIIFAHIMQVARPGDRIIVVYGAGHAFWLRQMVSTTPGYRLVEPNDYLLTAD
ncbi:DUF5694 domain-containing protein [Brevundimonas sp. FT23042]|uniref:DUF5694 domain-containing protein n=1 Tax=Brevundimonas sp. FT23042 TaxID=3393749 RepID=UPI003B587E8F